MANGYKRICRNALSSLMRLPVELQTEIFLRLPVTSLSICKRVCKAFRTVIENPDFEHDHINTSHSLLLQFLHKPSDQKIDRSSHALVSIDNTTKDVISYISLIPRIPYVGILFLIGSCNGLVCFAVRTTSMNRDEILLLWNPFTEQSRYIPIPNIDGYTHKQTMEFYFVPETNDCNILSIGHTFTQTGIHVAVYRMSTSSWEIVDRIRLGNRLYYYELYNDYGKREHGTSVFINGSFHWIFSSTDYSEIVSFNVRDEELSRLKCIHHDSRISGGIYDIGIIEESLALLYWSYLKKNIEIWVMSDYEVQDSWVSKYKRGPNDDYVCLEGCWKNSVMTSDQHSLYFYNTNELKMKKLLSRPENFLLSGFSSFSSPWLPVAR